MGEREREREKRGRIGLGVGWEDDELQKLIL